MHGGREHMRRSKRRRVRREARGGKRVRTGGVGVSERIGGRVSTMRVRWASDVATAHGGGERRGRAGGLCVRSAKRV